MTRGEPIASQMARAGFGDLQRRHRLAAGLTHESLAERAGLSVHGIQKLEHRSLGRHPYEIVSGRG